MCFNLLEDFRQLDEAIDFLVAAIGQPNSSTGVPQTAVGNKVSDMLLIFCTHRAVNWTEQLEIKGS